MQRDELHVETDEVTETLANTNITPSPFMANPNPPLPASAFNQPAIVNQPANAALPAAQAPHNPPDLQALALGQPWTHVLGWDGEKVILISPEELGRWVPHHTDNESGEENLGPQFSEAEIQCDIEDEDSDWDSEDDMAEVYPFVHHFPWTEFRAERNAFTERFSTGRVDSECSNCGGMATIMRPLVDFSTNVYLKTCIQCAWREEVDQWGEVPSTKDGFSETTEADFFTILQGKRLRGVRQTATLGDHCIYTW